MWAIDFVVKWSKNKRKIRHINLINLTFSIGLIKQAIIEEFTADFVTGCISGWQNT